MIELLILAGVWILAAAIYDLKKREVPNWLSFSLIIFVLVYRAFFAFFNNDLWFFLYGLIGLGVFVFLGYVFYYARIFAGGDAKLLMALGAVLPLSSGLIGNVKIFLIFIFLLLLVGSVYGLVYSFVLVTRNKKSFVKEFKKQFKARRMIFYFSLVCVILSLFIVFYINDLIFLFFPILFLVFPFLFVYAKAIEEACMIKEVKAYELTEGDWLYQSVRVGRKVIKPYWEGLNEDELKLLRKYKGKIKIKVGIPFIPVFFLAFLLFVLLWYSSWGFLKQFGLL